MKSLQHLVSFACLVTLGVLGSACSTPLGNRTARVVPVGQFEASGSATGFGFVGPASTSQFSVPTAMPGLEVAGRFGLADRVDAQLRLDTFLYPEFALGYQFLGDPKANDFAASVVVGGRFFVFPLGGGAASGNLSLPVSLLLDIPVGPATLTLGSRNIIGVGIGGSIGGTSSLTLTPGLTLGGTMPIADTGLFVRGELGANMPILLAGDTNFIGGGNNVAFYAASVGVGYMFGKAK
jgi:hypothetical protein